MPPYAPVLARTAIAAISAAMDTPSSVAPCSARTCAPREQFRRAGGRQTAPVFATTLRELSPATTSTATSPIVGTADAAQMGSAQVIAKILIPTRVGAPTGTVTCENRRAQVSDTDSATKIFNVSVQSFAGSSHVRPHGFGTRTAPRLQLLTTTRDSTMPHVLVNRHPSRVGYQ